MSYVIVLTREGYETSVFGPYDTHGEADIEFQLISQSLPEWKPELKLALGRVSYRVRAVCENKLMDELDK